LNNLNVEALTVKGSRLMRAIALVAPLVACASESTPPAPPTAVPAPAVAPQATPPSAPDEKAPKTLKDSTDTGIYPWQSGPIASL
jgi:hypothetical protein